MLHMMMHNLEELKNNMISIDCKTHLFSWALN